VSCLSYVSPHSLVCVTLLCQLMTIQKKSKLSTLCGTQYYKTHNVCVQFVRAISSHTCRRTYDVFEYVPNKTQHGRRSVQQQALLLSRSRGGSPAHCSVKQCVAVRCSVLQCVAVRCSALQCVAVRCSVSPALCGTLRHTATHCNTLL